MTMIYVLLVAHFVWDFICQTDWMAQNKSKRWDALAFHVGVYTLVLAVIVAFSQPDSEYPYTTLKHFGWFVLVNGAAHFAQDAITSRINARLWFFQPASGVWEQPTDANGYTPMLWNPWVLAGGDRHWFFVGIGADQLLHYVTLFVTAGWWLR